VLKFKCKTPVPKVNKNNNKMHQLNYSNIEYETGFMSGANAYMFRHQGAIIKEFIKNKGL